MHPKWLQNTDQFNSNDYLISNAETEFKVFSYRKETEKTRKKTESMTFRLESEILHSLRQEARRKDISLNTLVSQITKHHTHWHSLAPHAGFIYVRKPFLIKLLESQNDEEIKSLAKHIAVSSNKDFILMLRMKYNIFSALDVIETWISISGYSYNHSTEYLGNSEELHSFIVQHNMGMKWSLYLGELYKNLFEEFGIRNAQFDITNSTLAFEIVVPKDEK
jgi:hypothetical protein